MKKFKKMLTDMRRTEKVQVRKYTRSKFGNFLFFAFLFLFGAFSVLPLIYSIVTSFKPLDEILVFPPAILWQGQVEHPAADRMPGAFYQGQ